MKIGILYIGIGKYIQFWDEFYKSCESFFMSDIEKKYIVFTDMSIENKYKNINYIYQEDLGWPGNTLFRYKMFSNNKSHYADCDYVYFFNSNTLFLSKITFNEFSPSYEDNYLLSLSWNIYKNKNKKDLPYERNCLSNAYIQPIEGRYYYQGGINGGRRNEFNNLVDTCKQMIDEDYSNKIIAINHDESHLNKYLLERTIKVIDDKYGKPEEWKEPKKAKIIFRDKKRLLGKNYIKKLKPTNSFSIYKRISIYIIRKLRNE